MKRKRKKPELADIGIKRPRKKETNPPFFSHAERRWRGSADVPEARNPQTALPKTLFAGSVEKPETGTSALLKELPEHYGDNHIYVMVRDSYWVFAYWEIQGDHREKTLGRLGGSWDRVKSILRVYDVTNPAAPSFFDVVLQHLASSWYLQVCSNRRYVVEIGLLHEAGRFLPLARSNEVLTPRSGISEIIDEQWMGIDFDKMYALSGGFELGKSSMELKQLMEERLAGAISSGSLAGAISSMASPTKIKPRGFWFVLDCELILSGATEPDASVFLQGKPVRLRSDGTFTLRFALPDGKLVLDTHAHSSDGLEERIIMPVVERRTKRPAPILRSESKLPKTNSLGGHDNGGIGFR